MSSKDEGLYKILPLAKSSFQCVVRVGESIQWARKTLLSHDVGEPQKEEMEQLSYSRNSSFTAMLAGLVAINPPLSKFGGEISTMHTHNLDVLADVLK